MSDTEHEATKAEPESAAETKPQVSENLLGYAFLFAIPGYFLGSILGIYWTHNSLSGVLFYAVFIPFFIFVLFKVAGPLGIGISIVVGFFSFRAFFQDPVFVTYLKYGALGAVGGAVLGGLLGAIGAIFDCAKPDADPSKTDTDEVSNKSTESDTK